MKLAKRIKPYAVSSTLPVGITLDMILGTLHSRGYATLHKPSKEHPGINRLALLPTENPPSNRICPSPAQAPSESTVHLARLEHINQLIDRKGELPSPTIAFASSAEATTKLLDKLDDSQKDSIAIVASKHDCGPSFEDLITNVSNYLTNIIEFGTVLLQTTKDNGTFQDIVSTAERFCGLYIGVADANNMLVAYPQNSAANDSVSISLVELGFHTKERTHHPSLDVNRATDPKRRGEIIIYDPQPPFPYSLATYEIYMKGNFFALVIMVCPEAELNDGLIGAFSMIAQSCERIAKRECRNSEVSNLAMHDFLSRLFASNNLDRVFIQEQANRLHIPTHGAFTLACVSLQHEFSDQLNYIASEVDRMLSHKHWVHISDNCVYILFFAESWEEAMEANVTLSELKLGDPYEMYSSDVYSTLRDTYYAYKQICCIRKYITLVRYYRSLTNSSKHANVFAFHDVFCFFWDDPFAESELKGFALDHTRSSIIEQDDIANGTNNLPLLNAFLTLERKATLVGELFHLHRNGVLYRIDKIEKTYHLDLFDYLTRQYLQTCARIKLIANSRLSSLDPNDNPLPESQGEK